MSLTTEDETLAIPKSQHQYILHLKEPPTTYTRFFDALLIPRPSHKSFLTDLQSFRSQTHIINLLSTCDSTLPDQTKESVKQTYRQITQSFLSSRFAHPWCRKAAAGSGNSSGWWGAEWRATGRKMSRDMQDQEDKLHRTLVPIWVVMKARMFPGGHVVEEWWKEELRREEERMLKKRLDVGVVGGEGQGQQQQQQQQQHQQRKVTMRLGQSQPQSQSNTTTKPQPMTKVTNNKQTKTFNPEIYVSEDYDDDYFQNPNQTQNHHNNNDDDDNNEETNHQQVAQVATGVLRLAAAGLIVSTMPKRKLWKLSRGK